MPSCSLSASSAFSPSARDRQRSRRSSARSASCDKTEILQEKAPGHCDKSRFSTSMKALLKVQPTVRRCSTLRSDKGWTICWILQILLSEAGKSMILCICALICWIIIVFSLALLLHRKTDKKLSPVLKRLLLCCFSYLVFFYFLHRNMFQNTEPLRIDLASNE